MCHIGHHHLHGRFLYLLYLPTANYFVRPRFFPFGDGPVNEEGVAHYDDMIASMIEYGIKPAVTLFHWGQFPYIPWYDNTLRPRQIPHLHFSTLMVLGQMKEL